MLEITKPFTVLPTYSILHDLVIKAPASEVFDAISTPQHLNNWWTARSSGKPKLGTPYNFFFTPEYDWYGEVTACRVNQLFSISMTQADEDWHATSFSFELEPNDGEVLVRFSHTGWQTTNPHFRRTSFCWAILLKGLKDYVEKGGVVPFEERV